MANPAFSVEAATQAYLATVSGVARAKSDAYFEGGYWLILWSFVVTAVIMIFLMRSGWAAKISDWARRITGGRPWLHAMLAAFVLIGIVAVLQFPWDLYVTYFREHQYGMSNQNFGQWLGDWVKNALISLIVFTLLASGMLRLIRATPKNWWAWGAVVTAGFMAFFIAVAPVFVEPLFNTYKPMAESPLRDQILSMARANGVPAHDVLVVDASRQTKRISANVAGLGSTMRVALNDNLLNQATPPQVRSVMGHELGHYVLNHIWSMVIYFALIILGGYLAINHFVPALLRRNPNLPPERNPGQAAPPVPTLLASVLGLQRGLPAIFGMSEYTQLRASGVAGLRIDRTVGPIFQSGVTTSLVSGQKNINRRRMADFIQDSVAQRLVQFNKLPLTTALKDSVTSEIDTFLNLLKSPSNPPAQRIVDFLGRDAANAGAAVNFSAGTKRVMISPLGSRYFGIKVEVGHDLRLGAPGHVRCLVPQQRPPQSWQLVPSQPGGPMLK